MAKSIGVINTENAAPAGGHYVQATTYNGLIYISGQLPVRPDRSHTFADNFEVQARQAMQNLIEILKAAGSEPSKLLKVTVYLADVENWPLFNQIYAEMLGEAKPARSIVPVPNLHYGYAIEIDAIAVISDP
ncbi:RidA family protein [Dyadobacter sp. CY345]|uniref:RidA family protein n=1 Tax=Dyadobacter sp. CY345 TaxID=2909335 RepID=UPI001F2D5436|nr:RidA family protein [Dyadobacter sp. CY345]MCF2446556.1 RidA family protein [Dyadobacter sp. CY345]